MIFVKNFLSQCFQIVSYIINPPQCFSCKKYTANRVILCNTCEESLILIAPKMFQINSSYILTVYTLSRYTEPLRPMLFAKYRSDITVLEKLAELIWQKSVLSQVKIDCFIPIPLHWSRNAKRGFNQTEIFAHFFSKQSNIPIVHALKRIRATKYQIKVENSDRLHNVKNAFKLTDDNLNLQNKHIMLVDDSCTTGSTAIEAAKILTKFKPASINMIVACRAL